MNKFKYFKKFLVFSVCSIAICFAIAIGCANIFSANALTENRGNSNTEQTHQYHDYDMDNFQVFFDYLNSLGYDLNDIADISSQDYLQSYWKAMDLGIIIPLENDFLLAKMPKNEPFWGGNNSKE